MFKLLLSTISAECCVEMGDKTVERLATYAASLEYDNLPSDVVHQVKRVMVDSMGCGIRAFDSVPAKPSEKWLRSTRVQKQRHC